MFKGRRAIFPTKNAVECLKVDLDFLLLVNHDETILLVTSDNDVVSQRTMINNRMDYGLWTMVRVFIKLSDVSKCLCTEILTISENMAFIAFLHLKNQTNSFDFIVMPTLAPDLVAV